jgi:hypothetical protein
MPERFTCSLCKQTLPRSAFHCANYKDRQRDVPARCKKCRAETRFRALYPNSICAQCRGHRQVQSNKICRRCNAESALRECKACKNVLPVLLEFEGRRSTCRACRKATPPSVPPAE